MPLEITLRLVKVIVKMIVKGAMPDANFYSSCNSYFHHHTARCQPTLTFTNLHLSLSLSPVKEELLRNPNLMPFGLWLFTVLCVAIAIIFGVVSCIFSIINTVMSPIESISGLPGLYLWNGMGGKYLQEKSQLLQWTPLLVCET